MGLDEDLQRIREHLTDAWSDPNYRPLNAQERSAIERARRFAQMTSYSEGMSIVPPGVRERVLRNLAVTDAIVYGYPPVVPTSGGFRGNLAYSGSNNSRARTHEEDRIYQFILQNLRSYNTAIAIGAIDTRPEGWSDWKILGLANARSTDPNKLIDDIFAAITGKISFGILPNGIPELFTVSYNRDVWHSWQENGNFVGWHSLGGIVTGDIGIGRNEDSRLEVFVRGTNNRLYHKYKRNPWGDWSEWEDMEGYLRSAPRVANCADGNLGLFAVGQDGALWHRWQHEPNGWSGWSEWHSLGGTISNKFVVGKNEDKRLEVFAIGTDGQVYSNWQQWPNLDWSGWQGCLHNEPGKFVDVAVGNTAAGQLELFGLKRVSFGEGMEKSRLFHKWQHEANGWNGWSDWHPMAEGYLGYEVTVVRNQWDSLEIFAPNIKHQMGHIYYSPWVSDDWWSKWLVHPSTEYILSVTPMRVNDKVWVIAQTSSGYLIKHHI